MTTPQVTAIAAPDEIALKGVARVILTDPEEDDIPIDPPLEQRDHKTIDAFLEKLDRESIATIVWQRVGKDPDTGIALLAAVARVPEASLREALAVEGAYEAKKTASSWKHFTLEAIITVGLLILVGLGVYSLSGQGTTELTGLQDAVTRSFAGTTRVSFTVAEFDTGDHAEDGLRALQERLENAGTTIPFDDLETIALPVVLDNAVAYQASVPVGSVALPVSIVIVRDGVFLHIMLGVASTGDAPSEPAAIVSHLFGESPYAGLVATPDATEPAEPGYTTGGLWDRLPTPQQLPPGYVVTGEFTGLNDHLFGG
jgi:hypothetical protein